MKKNFLIALGVFGLIIGIFFAYNRLKFHNMADFAPLYSSQIYENDDVPITSLDENGEKTITHTRIYNDCVYYIEENFDGNFKISEYDDSSKITRDIYIRDDNDDFLNQIIDFTVNNDYIIIFSSDRAELINIDTQSVKEILRYSDGTVFSVYGTCIFFSDGIAPLQCYSVKTGKTTEITQIRANSLAIINDTMCYIDIDNRGKLSSYNILTEEIHNYDTDYVIGFNKIGDEFYVDYADKSIPISKYLGEAK